MQKKTTSQTIGEYRIISTIGQGGMGKVYKAVHPATKKFIIIKKLLMTSKVLAQRFKREAEIMTKFNHRNIVKVYDFFQIGSTNYIAMEFVDGLSLEDLIANREHIAPTPALLIFNEACKGLKYAHDKEVVHRDIKPDNVLLSKKGEVKLVDFGIATALPDSDEELTKTGVIMGTPAYMSPEQLTDSKHVDKKSDIYSMGVMLYYMMTGQKPYAGAFTAETISKIQSGDYIPPSKVNPAIPDFFSSLIKRAMHPNKNKRFKDMNQILDNSLKFLGKYKTPAGINGAIMTYVAGKEITDVFADKLKVPKQLIVENKTYKLKRIMTVGRERDNDIIIEKDSSVSRKHAIIEKKGAVYFIKDKSSANGTFVKKKRIPKEQSIRINIGDDIRLAKTTLRLI